MLPRHASVVLAAESERTAIKKSKLLRARAYPLLGVTVEEVAVAPQITPELREIAKTIRREGQPKRTRRSKVVNSGVDSTTNTTINVAIDEETPPPYGPGADLHTAWPHYLGSDDHPDAKKVLLAYHSVPHYCRTLLPIEAYCVAAKVSPLSILGILVGSIVRMGAAARTVIAMVNQPRVVQKSVEMALTDDGIADRELLAKATGFLPTPKGSQTIVNVAANASAEASPSQAVVLAPPPEQTIRRLVDRFNDARGITSPVQSALPEAPMIPSNPLYEREAIEVEAESDEDDA